jgi:hypothetical protein
MYGSCTHKVDIGCSARFATVDAQTNQINCLISGLDSIGCLVPAPDYASDDQRGLNPITSCFRMGTEIADGTCKAALIKQPRTHSKPF